MLGLLRSPGTAIQLGTNSTRIYVAGARSIFEEPTLIAFNEATGRLDAVGRDAKDLFSHNPGSAGFVNPLREGFVSDQNLAAKMLRQFLMKAYGRKYRPLSRAIVALPEEHTQLNKYALYQVMRAAKATEVRFVNKYIAAAAGIGLPLDEPAMLVHFGGGGAAEITVMHMGHTVYSQSVRTGGNVMDKAIVNYVKRCHNLVIGERTAEQIKITLGSAYPLDRPCFMEVTGRTLIEGIPKTIYVDDFGIREALSESISKLMLAVRFVLEHTPPELSADISDRGIVLTGGSALLKNLDKRIREETGLPVYIADNPSSSIIRGLAHIMSSKRIMNRFSDIYRS